MTPKQLIDACKDTSHPMPSGKKVAEVLEMLLMQRDTLAQTFAETCAELGCAQDNEAALMAIHALRERIKELEAYGKGMEEVFAELGTKTQVYAERLAAAVAERDDLRESLALAAETEAFARARITEVEAERDELARALVLSDPYNGENWNGWRAGQCRGCKRYFEGEIEETHSPGCPVALAEKIVKGARP